MSFCLHSKKYKILVQNFFEHFPVPLCIAIRFSRHLIFHHFTISIFQSFLQIQKFFFFSLWACLSFSEFFSQIVFIKFQERFFNFSLPVQTTGESYEMNRLKFKMMLQKPEVSAEWLTFSQFVMVNQSDFIRFCTYMG